MKKLLKIAGIGFLGFIIFVIVIGILYPVSPEVQISSFKDKNEVTSELLDVSGKYKGSPDKILVNGQEAEKKYSDSSFKKVITLKPGENLITVEAYSKGKVVYKTEGIVIFDLEGKYYLEKEQAYKKQIEEAQKENTRVPEYELVRKEESNGTFSGIVYADIMNVEAVREYLVANLVKDIKAKNNNSSLSLLIFSKNDKAIVEGLLEKTDLASLSEMSKKVRAEYSKTTDSEDLFIYPTGLEGDKLAVATI